MCPQITIVRVGRQNKGTLAQGNIRKWTTAAQSSRDFSRRPEAERDAGISLLFSARWQTLEVAILLNSRLAIKMVLNSGCILKSCGEL